MVRTKDCDGGVKSSMIISEVKKRACLFDTNDPSYGDRAEKSRCWEEVCDNVVPGWSSLTAPERLTAGKEVQKRWRSIRDSYTKMFRQGKCLPAEQCVPGTRRYNYHRELAFLRHALMNKKPRFSQEKYESCSEVSNSPQHTIEDIPRIKTEIIEKPLDLKTKPDREKPAYMDKIQDKLAFAERPEKRTFTERAEKRVYERERRTYTHKNEKRFATNEKMPSFNRKDAFLRNLDKESFDQPKAFEQPKEREFDMEKSGFVDRGNQARTIDKQSLEIKIDANSILPDDHFDDDRLFMNSLIPLFKKMTDDTRLLCRIEVLKIIRYALQGHKCFEALKVAEDSFFKDQMSGILKEETKSDSKLCMTTRSADGSRPVRKRRIRSPSPLPMPPKKRGPGRPRKVRPPPSDSEEEPPRRRCPKLKVCPVPVATDPDDSYGKATSVDQLSTPMFMKMYNLTRSEFAPALTSSLLQVPIKIEPDTEDKAT